MDLEMPAKPGEFSLNHQEGGSEAGGWLAACRWQRSLGVNNVPSLRSSPCQLKTTMQEIDNTDRNTWANGRSARKSECTK